MNYDEYIDNKVSDELKGKAPGIYQTNDKGQLIKVA